MLNKVKIRYIFATLCSLAVLNAADLSFPGDRANLQLQTQAHAKKSGGRSGGGSFRSSPSNSSRSNSSSSSSSRSSRSSSSSPSRNTTPSRSPSERRDRTAPSTYPAPRTVTPPPVQPRSQYREPVYVPPQPPVIYRQPVYVPPQPPVIYRQPVYVPPQPPVIYRDRVEDPAYRNPSSTSSGAPTTSNTVNPPESATPGDYLILFLVLMGVGIPVFLLLFLLFKKIGSARGNTAATVIEKERDNDTVTLSKLQVGLLVTDSTVQHELSQLSSSVDTGTPEGLWELLQESLLILQRNSDVWTYAVSSSEATNIETAEVTFQQRCFEERSKFSRETLSNVEGELKTMPVATLEENIGAYVVVTLLLGTADDKPLFGAIRSTEELKDAIAKLAAMRSDYLMTFYLFWTPQQAGVGLSDEEMITEYTDLYRLA